MGNILLINFYLQNPSTVDSKTNVNRENVTQIKCPQNIFYLIDLPCSHIPTP